MAFGLPIVVPDLPYAHSICEDAALYYTLEKPEDAFRNIWTLYKNKDLWQECSNKSIKQFNKYPTPKAWVEKYFQLLKK